MLIRPETAADHATIARINIAAFADHPHSRQTEHLIVAALRNAGALTLSLVAEDRGEVVGQAAECIAALEGGGHGGPSLGMGERLSPTS